MEEIEKRLKAAESGFMIVANDVVGKIEEAHKDIRERGRESRDQGRELREIRRDMTASFGQIAGTMATKQDLEEMETRILAGFQHLAAILVERLPPKQGGVG